MTSNSPIDTPYASFNTASREVSSNGGAWYSLDSAMTVIPHQSMGGATDLFQLTGIMQARVVIPRDVAQIGDKINVLFTFIACEVRMDGDIRDYAMFWSGLNIPFCPSMSDTLVLPLTPNTLISNPLIFNLLGESVLRKQATIYLGNFQLSLSKADDGIPSSAGSSSSADLNGLGGSTSTFSGLAPTYTSTTSSSSIALPSGSGMVNGNGTQFIGGSSTTLPNGGTTVIPVLHTTNDQHSASSVNSGNSSLSSVQAGSNGGRAAVIVGSVLGSLFLLTTALFLIVYTLRRQRRKEERGREAEKLASSDGNGGDTHGIESLNKSTRSSSFNNYKYNYRDNRSYYDRNEQDGRHGSAIYANSNLGSATNTYTSFVTSISTPLPGEPGVRSG